jgi:hypothetical protein
MVIALLTLPVGLAQTTDLSVSSSEDIMVADGLQLPDYGVMWALDKWKGADELVQLNPAVLINHSLSIRSSHSLQIAGEAATVRIHREDLQIFVHGVSGDGASSRAGFILVRLMSEGARRHSNISVSNGSASHLRNNYSAGDVVELTRQQVGTTDWYRLIPKQRLLPDEYAILPLPGDAGALAGGIRDFAIDPTAPENSKAIVSEKDQGSH